jgi:protocatechuate 3,4-dioxygenase, alpha subunit
MRSGATPSQTVGPFFHVGLVIPDAWLLVSDEHPGAVRIEGVVRDGANERVPDALIEIWQAGGDGRFPPGDSRGVERDFGFTGFGRCATDDDGRFRFVTVKPGSVREPNGGKHAPHIDVSVFARGLLKRLVTRIYFPDESAANASDPVLGEVPPERRNTLIASSDDGVLRFDIKLRGDGETVFFDV